MSSHSRSENRQPVVMVPVLRGLYHVRCSPYLLAQRHGLTSLNTTPWPYWNLTHSKMKIWGTASSEYQNVSLPTPAHCGPRTGYAHVEHSISDSFKQESLRYLKELHGKRSHVSW